MRVLELKNKPGGRPQISYTCIVTEKRSFINNPEKKLIDFVQNYSEFRYSVYFFAFPLTLSAGYFF